MYMHASTSNHLSIEDSVCNQKADEYIEQICTLCIVSKFQASTPKPGSATPGKKVMSGGIVMEETKSGHGPEAKSGKMVMYILILPQQWQVSQKW